MTKEQEQQQITDQLADRILKLEKDHVGVSHRHTGLDSQAVAISDLQKVIRVTATINPASLGDGVGETKDIAVSNVNPGDWVLVSAPYDLQGILVTAYVKQIGTVSIRLQNETTGTIDLASGTWNILIIKKF